MIPFDYLQIISPITGLLVNIFFQVIACRYLTRANLFKSFFLGFFLGLLSLIFFDFYNAIKYNNFDTNFWLILFSNIVIYFSLSFCYEQLIGSGISLRIRILYYIMNSHDGLSYNQLFDQFDTMGLYNRRLKRLVEIGQILEFDEKYYTKNSLLLFISRFLILLRIIFIGKESEFD